MLDSAAGSLLLAALLAGRAAAAAPAPASALKDPAAEPALPAGLDIQDRPYPKLHYARFPGGPLAAALRWDRVIQGELGSCFFLSTLAAIARTHPGFIAGEVRSAGGGAYAVTLFGPDGRRRAVLVDDRFPATASGAPFFGRGLGAGEIRPALFEKAFAKLSGGYSAIDGGDAADAFRALTGAPGRDHATRSLSDDAAWRLLAAARRAGRPVVASSLALADLKRATGRADLAGVIDDHVYAFLDLFERGGERFVRLYTPLSPGDAGYADGPRLLELRLRDFRSYFDAITVGRVAAAPR